MGQILETESMLKNFLVVLPIQVKFAEISSIFSKDFIRARLFRELDARVSHRRLAPNS